MSNFLLNSFISFLAPPAGGPWDLTNASYDNVSFSVTDEETTPTTMFFKDDGTRMYVLGIDTDTVYQYTLSSAFDISTASFDNKSFSVTTQAANPGAIFFKPDGTRMFVTGIDNHKVLQYSLSVAWDISTASFDNKEIIVVTENGNTSGVFFRDDGTRMFVLGFTEDAVTQYTLSTAWDLSTASYDSVTFSVSSEDGNPREVFFKDDGTKMFIVGFDTDSVYQYVLSSAWDLTTASFDNVSFSITSEETTATGLSFKNDGTKMYVIGLDTDTIYQYSL